MVTSDTFSLSDPALRFVILGASGLVGEQFIRALRERFSDFKATYFRHARPGHIQFDMTAQSPVEVIPDLGVRDRVFILPAIVDQEIVHQEPQRAAALNVDATRRCIDAIAAHGAVPYVISTEAVFDGDQDGFREKDLTKPLTLYSKQKVQVEEHIRGLSGPWCLVRTGWNIGTDEGSRDPVGATYRHLLSGKAKMAYDNIFTLTDIRDTVNAIIKLVEYGLTGIYHIAANPPVGRTEFADWIIASSKRGNEMSYQAVAYSELRFPEPRPRRAWLRNEKFMDEVGYNFISPRDLVSRKVRQIDIVQAAVGRSA